jgi:FkbM family methyltransferase
LTTTQGVGFLNIPNKIREFIHLAAGFGKTAGLLPGVQWVILRFAVKLGFPEPAVWQIWPRQSAYALQMRLRGSSDIPVFDQIFIREEYSCLRELNEPSLVLDLGANVGFSSAYFLNIFPKARVVAVEPDERNLATCRVNLSPYRDRVLVLHGAVWSKPTWLRLSKNNSDDRGWATQVSECRGEEDAKNVRVRAWDVGGLIDMSGLSTVDLLKVDIERAELSVFGTGAESWLHKVRNICIELHGSDCEEVFFAALKDFDYDLGHFGELTVCRNLRAKKSAVA